MVFYFYAYMWFSSSLHLASLQATRAPLQGQVWDNLKVFPALLPSISSVFQTSISIHNVSHLLLNNFFFVQAKAEIRRLLPGGLQESISKVRSSVVSFIDV